MSDVTEPSKASSTGRTIAIAVATTIVSVAIVLAALWAVDAWARQQIASYVTDKVQQVLSLDDDKPVRVNVAGVSVIAQVLTGSLDEVTVGVDDVQIGDLRGGVELTATGVPIDLSKPVDAVGIEFRVGEKDLQSVAHLLTDAAIGSVELVGSEIRFASEFRIFAFRLTVGIGVEPFADEGQIGFTPTSVELNGSRTSAKELVKTFGSVAETLLQTRSFCVARWLPAALTVTEVVVRDKQLVVTIGATHATFDNASVQTLGTCPAGS